MTWTRINSSVIGLATERWRRHLDPNEPARFLATGYESQDSLAVFLKSYQTGRAMQRILPVTRILGSEFQEWLRLLNDGPDRWNMYVSVNAISPAKRARTREAIDTIRHVFLDIDASADAVLDQITGRQDLPDPSYVMRSSASRLHVLWRTSGMTKLDAEGLQRRLARDLGAHTRHPVEDGAKSGRDQKHVGETARCTAERASPKAMLDLADGDRWLFRGCQNDRVAGPVVRPHFRGPLRPRSHLRQPEEKA